MVLWGLGADVELLTTECRPVRLARGNSNSELIFVRKEISVVPTLTWQRATKAKLRKFHC